MFTVNKSLLAWAGLMLLGTSGFAGEELGPYVPRSRAPLDVRKSNNPSGTLSNAEARELSGEFGGILYMAQRPYVYERWPGKDMSDCQATPTGNACGECRMIMGHSNADYYFFRDADRQCTLQQIDAHFQASDPSVLRSLRQTAQQLLGTAVQGSKSASREPGWDGEGAGWKWVDDSDLAYLYMDTEQASHTGEGVARFQWRRAPLHKR